MLSDLFGLFSPVRGEEERQAAFPLVSSHEASHQNPRRRRLCSNFAMSVACGLTGVGLALIGTGVVCYLKSHDSAHKTTWGAVGLLGLVLTAMGALIAGRNQPNPAPSLNGIRDSYQVADNNQIGNRLGL